MRHMLITGVRPAGGVAAVDIRIAGGVVTESGPALARRHDEVETGEQGAVAVSGAEMPGQQGGAHDGHDATGPARLLQRLTRG